MPQSATATPDIFDEVGGSAPASPSSSSGDIFDEVGAAPEAKAELAKTPAELDFENKVQNAAIASVPKPAFLEGQPRAVDVLPGPFGFENEGGFGPPSKPGGKVPPLDVQRAIVGGLTDIATGGGMPSNEGAPPLGEPMAQGVRELETPGKRGTGALRVAATGAEALSPLMGPGALETGAAIEAAPTLTHAVLRALPMTGGMAAGYGASEAAGPVARKLGADPEQEQLVKDLAFWLPSVAGAILQPKFGAAVSPREVVVRGGVKVPVVGDVAAEVRIPRSQPPTPAGNIEEPIPDAPNAWEAAKGNLRPRTPLPSDDPAIASMAKAQAAETTAAKRAAGIPEPPQPTILDHPNAPPELQQNRIAPESIQRMATFVAGLPDAARDQAIQEAHGTLTAALTEMGKRGPVSMPDGTLSLIKSPEDASKIALGIINDAVKQHDKVSASLSGEGRGGKAPEAVSSPEAASWQVLKEEEPTSTQAAKPSAAPQESQQSALKKGDRVTLARDVKEGGKTLPAGTPVTIQYAHPNGLIVRAVTEDGTKISRGVGAFTKEVESGGGRPSSNAPVRNVPSGGTPATSAEASSGVRVPLESNGAEGGTLRGAGPGQHEQLPGGVPEGRSSGGNQPERTGKTPESQTPQPDRQEVKEAKVVYARHGETPLDQEGGNETVAGWSNEPLDDRGKAAAAQIAEHVKDAGVTQIVSSDLARAKQTADIIAKELGVPVTTDERLRPQHIPETEGKKVKEIQHIRDHYKEHPDEVPEGGESLNQFRERQDAAIAEIEKSANEGHKPLVVTHSTNLEEKFGTKPEPGGTDCARKGCECH